MNDLVHKQRSNQHLKPRGSHGTGTKNALTQRGPCGIDDDRAKCRGLRLNLLSVLLTSPNFSKVYKEVKSTGIKIVANEKLAVRASSARHDGAGKYDPITGTIELPTSVYASDQMIRSADTLKLIAHELYHAWQFRKLHKLAKGRGPEERAKIIARSVKNMGRERYIKSSLDLEYNAEEFGIKVALQALKNDHLPLQVYRSSIGPITRKNFAIWSLEGWWDANENQYQNDAEISYVQWMYRFSESDYAADFDKEALKAWLKRNPTIR